MARQLFGEEKKVDASSDATTKDEPGNLRWSTEQDGRYYIIIATERTEERIQTYVEQARTTLPKAALTALTALRSPRGRTIRLALTSFDSSAEAYAYLNELVKEHPAHRSAWVFHNN